jgi:glycosyltransferase involved in cell wall biosynthesis
MSSEASGADGEQAIARPGRAGPVQVLWLSIGLGPGGAERLLVSTAGRLDRPDLRCSAAYLYPWKAHLVAQLEARSVAVHCLDVRSPADPRWLLRLRRLVHRQDIDVVHFHSPLPAALARLTLRALRRRPVLVTTEHNVWPSHRLPTRLLNRWTIGLDDHTFAVSEEVRASMAAGVRDRVEVLVHGVDVAAIRPRSRERADARRKLGVPDDVLVVGAVANLRRTKDYPTMLRAAAELQRRGREVRFVSIGQGPLQEELEQLRDDLGLDGSFTFLGFQEDPLAILSGCDLFCLSSEFEGLSIALVEALALGLPAVVTDVGGSSQVIEHGVQGLLVPPGAPAALADAIESLEPLEIRRPMSAAAAARAEAFDIGPAADRQFRLYLDLATRRTRT